jgi:hypothetical protein
MAFDAYVSVLHTSFEDVSTPVMHVGLAFRITPTLLSLRKFISKNSSNGFSDVWLNYCHRVCVVSKKVKQAWTDSQSF